MDGSNARVVYWHDFTRTVFALRALWNPSERMSSEERICFAIRHVGIFLLNQANIGHPSVQRVLLTNSSAPPVNADWLACSGFSGFVPQDGGMNAEEMAAYERDLNILTNNNGHSVSHDVLLQNGYRELDHRLALAGVTLYFISSPIADRERVEYPDPARTFAFDDPARWPTLFKSEFRHDRYHLNTRGAGLFTRALAEQFVALLQKVPSRPPRNANGPAQGAAND
jgi:hypothetical protein